jgi:stalled ribosome rescue protein Dom34
MNNQKQFGVWMDTHHATVVGSENLETGELSVIAHVDGEEPSRHSNETHGQNHEQGAQQKFFKDIASHLTNATHIHITGTGIAQEQFITYLADTAQFKNSKTAESTSLEMSDEELVEYITANI